MEQQRYTIIDEGRAAEVDGSTDGEQVRLSPEALKTSLGWEVKPQGLCKDDRCVPIAGRPGLVNDRGVDVAAVAALLSRPIAIDADERVAYLGASAADRSAQLASLEAPDFTLPDLAGRPHSLSDYRGKKVFLVAYASW